MPVVVGIRFKDSGKTYYFDPNGIEALAQGDHVIVDTVRGPELAKVAYPPRLVDPEEIVGELKPVLRRAEPLDFERLRQLNSRQDELLARCAEKIQEHGLPMRLVKAEYSFDGSRLTFYFTAEKRVDFRALVRDLARTFRTRIELRQIGPRDEAKLLGGIGPCGRLLCCATFLPDYARVSIKMAKDQDLPLNPTKISGVCGRLLCCLSYEHEHYVSVKSRMPRKGTWVQTPDGPGEVVGVNVLRETVIVALASTGLQEEFSPSQIQEATRQVGEVARSRNAEGITPAARMRAERQERRTDQGQGRQGEKRLLRESINNPDVLEALAWLEEGMEDVPLELLEEEDLNLLSDETPAPGSASGRSIPASQAQRPSDPSEDLAALLGEATPQPPAPPAPAAPQRPRRRRRHRNT
ncbi:MAG: stage 0 sporulation family protein [Roseiflexaceae bacterium]|nr:stage 0 sporulation family protein [Roseiflexus sp.]MDW8214216.1 stage 0 sporulation family protein [Roseiflexaceae bacterium]